MTLTHSLVTLTGGAIAAAPQVGALLPASRGWLTKLVAWQGAIGVGLLVWGSYMALFKCLAILGSVLAAPAPMLVYLTSILADLAIGLVLGWPTLQRLWPARHAGMQQRTESLQRRLRGWQAALGILAIASGLGLLLLQLP